MKKMMKRIFAAMLAFAMMLCAVPAVDVAAEEKAYDVFVAFDQMQETLLQQMQQLKKARQQQFHLNLQAL